MTVNDELADATVMRAIRALRVANGVWADLLPILRDVERDLLERVERGVPRTLRSKRAQRLLREVREIIAAGAEGLRDEVLGTGERLARAEEAAAFRALDEALDLSIDWARPNAALLQTLAVSAPFNGALLTEHMQKWTEDQIFRMQAQIRIAIVEGEGIEPMQRRIRQVSEASTREARTIARTYTSHVTNEARSVLYELNKDIVAREQWVATLDTRTCVICASLDGQTFPVGRGTRAPVHMNCRCVRVPITRGAKALQARGIEVPRKRAASGELDGEAPADMTFAEWLRRRTPEEQREVLGETRFRLWQNGTPITEFVNDENQIIPLDDL